MSRLEIFSLFDITITAHSAAIGGTPPAGNFYGCAAGVAWECCPPMQDRIAGPPTATALVAFLAGAFLAGCSSAGDNPLTVFADPGKYQYSSCEQLAGQRKYWSTREQELKLLMDKAEQSAGGAIVNVLAYKADHVAASEELKVLEIAARAKNCETPENWRSNSVVR